MQRVLRDNGLTIALALLFAGSLAGQWLTGVRFQNEELLRHGQEPIGAFAYLSDPQFLSTLFENWESEFLQMAAYVVLTAVLFQRGSAESKDPDEKPPQPTDGKRLPREAPGALRKGPALRWLYAHSLGLALFFLFLTSFALHWLFSAKAAAEEALSHGARAEPLLQYVFSPQLWFESFQNWQSEFLSAGVLVVLSIWLRQTGSPESQTGDLAAQPDGYLNGGAFRYVCWDVGARPRTSRGGSPGGVGVVRLARSSASSVTIRRRSRQTSHFRSRRFRSDALRIASASSAASNHSAVLICPFRSRQ